MKKEILKIAGVKSEKEFYRKFPTEEAFMKKHGKEFKKAQNGTNAFIDSNTGLVESVTGRVSANDTFLSGFDQATSASAGKSSPNWKNQIGTFAGSAGELVQGFQQLRDEKRALQRARQMQAVSDVSLQASRTRPEQIQRRYVRPEDLVTSGEELAPVFGVGTNVLAKNGAEIANTFAPNTLYDDLGYEPLEESDRYKQFENGGKMRKAKGGFLSSLADAGGGQMGSSLITAIGGENAGGNIGGTIGKTAGQLIGGPVGGMIGQVGGQLIGGLLNRKPQKTRKANQATQRNVQNMALQQSVEGLQGANSSFMKNGGEVGDEYKWISHTWQPQKIVKFGEHNVKDLLKPPADADMLRVGGNLKEYTPPSDRAMSTERPEMEEGGELQIHWGGDAEPMSYNPYLPDGGETVMFRGQSHDESDGKGNTGIGITYGDNPVEVERGEPAMKMKDGGDTSSLVVFGNLKIPHTLLGDPSAKGKNFKKYIAELSKGEAKQNKIIEKSLSELENLDDNSSFGKLKLNSLNMNILGPNMKLKDYAQKKMDASALQTAMNDTIEELGLKTSDKGTIQAKKGAKIPQAQDGRSLPKLSTENYNYLRGLYNKAEKAKTGPEVLKFQQEFHRLAPDYAREVLSKEPVTRYGKGKKPSLTNIDLKSNEDSIFGKRTVQYLAAIENAGRKMETVESRQRPNITIPTKLNVPQYVKDLSKNTSSTPEKDNSDLINYFNQVLPYLRPTDAEPLDPNQLVGEMFALSQNQLEPVQAQTFQPELSVPYDISLQDILNENEASFRSQQRMIGYNPALQSQLAAQKYTANQKVLGEQFRMNQAMKDQVYKENRNLLNQSKLQNLGILDQQYQRQAQARSNTKATAQEALNSIAAKYAQNRLENRTLQVYENMYNYRFDPRFRAQNMNPLVDFQAMIDNASPEQLKDYTSPTKEKSKSKTAKNGSIVKALKNI